MRGLVLYRILSFIVTIFCSFLTAFLLISFMAVLATPSAAIVVFILGSVILYAWYARKFFFIVYIQQGVFTKRQKDWLQVNAIVGLLFSLYCMATALLILAKPEELTKALKQLPDDFLDQAGVSIDYMAKAMANAFKILLFACSALLVHIVWTYLLLRRHMAQHTEAEEG